MKRHKLLHLLMGIAVVVAVLMSIAIVKAANEQTTDTLQQYAAKCDLAIEETVPEFNCDKGGSK